MDLWQVVSEMQGWRISMEDAHLINPKIEVAGHSLALFGVFDGLDRIQLIDK